MKKLFAIVLALVLTCAVAFAAEGTITVMSREDGSGTRGAFVELTGVEQDDVDMTPWTRSSPTPPPSCSPPWPATPPPSATSPWAP